MEPMQENVDEGRNVVHYQEDHSSEAHERSPPLENQLASMSVEQGKAS